MAHSGLSIRDCGALDLTSLLAGDEAFLAEMHEAHLTVAEKKVSYGVSY